MKTSKRERRTFTKEFKEEALRLVSSGKRTVTEVASSLGVHQSLLSKWVRAQKEEGTEAFRGNGTRTAADEELWRLRNANKQLSQELEFLKKVSRYFVKDQK